MKTKYVVGSAMRNEKTEKLYPKRKHDASLERQQMES